MGAGFVSMQGHVEDLEMAVAFARHHERRDICSPTVLIGADVWHDLTSFSVSHLVLCTRAEKGIPKMTQPGR